jgi:hypothetical protein
MFNLFSGSMVGYLIFNNTIFMRNTTLQSILKLYHSKDIKSAGFYGFLAVG